MALFRKLFYKKPPDGLLEICERVYAFDCCFSTDALEEENYNDYIGGIVSQLKDQLPDASFLVFNFREGQTQSQLADILSEYDMTIMDYPRQYEGCPLLTMEMLHHFLRSCESWLSLGQHNVLIMHCEHGGWPVLAFMLAALLIYRKLYSGELKTLDMIYRQAPRELLHFLSPLNPIPSQLRYLQYVSRRNVASEWPPSDRTLTLDCIILRFIPNFDGEGGCRPIFRIYGHNPLLDSDKTTKVLYSTPKRSKAVRTYKQAESELVKFDIKCHIQGDVVLECISLYDDMEREVMMLRVMFNTAFIRSNILILTRNEIDTLWDTKDQFPKDFRTEILFSEMDAADVEATEVSHFEEKEGLPVEVFAKVHEIFNCVDWLDPKADLALNMLQQISTPHIVHEVPEADCNHKFETSLPISPRTRQEENKHGRKSSLSAVHISETLSPPESSPAVDTIKEADMSGTEATNIITASEAVLNPVEETKSASIAPSTPRSVVPSKTCYTKHITPPPPPTQPPPRTPHTSYPPNLSQTHFVAKENESSPKDEAPSVSLSAQPHTIQPWSAPPLPPPPPSKGNSSIRVGPPKAPPPPPEPPFKHNQAPRIVPPPPPPPKVPPPPPPPPPTLSGTVAIRGGRLPPPPPPPPTPAPPFKHTQSLGVPPQPPPPPASLFGNQTVRARPPPPPPPPLRSENLSGRAISSPAPPPPPPVPPVPPTSSLTSSLAPPAPPPPANGMSKKNSSSMPPSPAPPSAPPFNSVSGAKGRLSRTISSRNSHAKKLKPLHWLKLSRAVQGSLWAEAQKSGEVSRAPEIDMSELESLFSAAVLNSDHGGKSTLQASRGPKSDRVQLIDHRRAYNCEIMLSKVKVPLHDLMGSVLALEDSALDVDQVDNLIKFSPTKEEMELLKGYSGDKQKLGKCEQFFLELMKVPRVESKLRVFSFKMQFRSQVADLRKSLNMVNAAAEEIKNSAKLKQIMQTILSLGNALNQGTARGSAIGFRLDSLLKLAETRARDSKMTLMHYLCKVVADKLPELLDFSKDLISLEPSSKIQLKFLAEEMQAISKGLEKVVQELSTSENDGPISEHFCKALKEFLRLAEAEVRSLASLYSGVGRNVDSLIIYFGEDPARCPFEQVISTLLNFVRMFNKAHDENCRQHDLEMKKAAESSRKKIIASHKESERLLHTQIENGNVK